MASADAAIEVRSVRLTHPDKVVYRAQGITKRALACYYERVEEWVLPHLAERPLTLVRCPKGSDGACFYQKHAKESLPEVVRRIGIEGDDEPYMYVTSLEGVLALVQLGVLELHTWGARVDDLERPDRMVFDLDPGAGASWKAVVEGARQIRSILEGVRLPAFVKATGGEGLHVTVPLVRRHGWDEVRAFARAVADALVEREPDRYVATMSKEKRRGKVFIDYLRNAVNATVIAPYSTRARPQAPVAVPLRWDELRPSLDPAGYTIASVPRRLAALDADPWRDYEGSRSRITQEMRQALEGG